MLVVPPTFYQNFPKIPTLRNRSIVEGFISALLETQGYKSVKIIALLESESNKEDSKGKRSLADLIVEDQDHKKYIRPVA